MATSIVNPEVIRMPHFETPLKMRGKPMLFKGLEPGQFSRYFEQSGIDPYQPDRPWLTNHIATALEYGGLSPINNPAVKRGDPIDDLCVAVISPDVLDRGHLKSVRTSDVPLLSFGLRHYQGKEHIDWQDIMELIVTPKVMQTILRAHNLAAPRDLPEQILVDKLGVIEPASAPTIRKKVESAAHRIVELDPHRSYNPW